MDFELRVIIAKVHQRATATDLDVVSVSPQKEDRLDGVWLRGRNSGGEKQDEKKKDAQHGTFDRFIEGFSVEGFWVRSIYPKS